MNPTEVSESNEAKLNLSQESHVGQFASPSQRAFKLQLIGKTSPKRLILSVILGLALSYFGVLFYGLMFADRMIFLPPVTEYRDTSGTVKLKSRDGVEISAVYLPNPYGSHTILFSHGNAEDLGTLARELESMRTLGFAVFAYDYHGYGTSGGKATEQKSYEDIDAAYDYLTQILKVPPERIIAHGRSLGGAVAIDLASRKPLGGLIVESSFVSAFRVVTGYPVFPFDKFRNSGKIRNVHCPVLIIHGRQDEVIPFWHGERLFALANEPKMKLWVDSGHNNLKPVAGHQYARTMLEFVDLLKAQSQSE
jgi:fermentation-respiration switch protein FrsA (DUF1100 family)